VSFGFGRQLQLRVELRGWQGQGALNSAAYCASLPQFCGSDVAKPATYLVIEETRL